MSFYWSIGVMVTIVYYLPTSTIEVVFMIFIIIFTTVIFGYIINTIGNILGKI